MVTDGDLPVVDLRRVEASAAPRLLPATDSRYKRPASTTFSAGVALLRGLVGVVLAMILFVDPTAVPDLTGSMARSSIVTGTAITLLGVAALDIGLGLATYVGRNWSRVLLMLSCAATIVVAFVATARGGPRPTLGSDLPHVGLGILVLLALTSAGARQYATRGRRVGAAR